MENNSSLTANRTQIPTVGFRPTFIGILIITALFLLIASFLFFFVLMISTFYSTTQLREQSRYILFMYMLINDAAYLLTSELLFLFLTFLYKIPVLACYVVVTTSSIAFLNSPNGLAVMALERYVAICYPLRHTKICQVETTWVAIVAISSVGFFPYFIDLIILFAVSPLDPFSNAMFCTRGALVIIPAQDIIRYFMHAATFTMDGVIIVYTYVQIMLEAKKANGDKSSSSKASKTVMLHAFQLFLCMTSFSHGLTEFLLNAQFVYLRAFNLFTFMFFPRFLSPLIYGFRDETIRTHMKALLHCYSRKVDSQTRFND